MSADSGERSVAEQKSDPEQQQQQQPPVAEVDAEGEAAAEAEEHKSDFGALTAEEKKRLANKRKKDKAKQRKQQQKQQTGEQADDSGSGDGVDGGEMRQLASSFPALSMHRFFQPPLSLACNPRQGRHLLLSSSLPSHSLLFSQQPYAAVVTDSHVAGVCHRCLSSEARVMLKCSSCQYAHYCSSPCKRAHERLHAVECSLLARLARTEGSSASIRLLIRLLLQRREEEELINKHRDKRRATKRQDKEPSVADTSLPSSLQPGQTFSDANSLQSHAHSIGAQARLELLSLLASLRTLLGASFTSLGDEELMLRLLCIVHVNAHHITSVSKDRVALGLFTAPSLMNHSCLPSALYHFTDRGELHMRLLAGASKGAELTYAYTDVYQRRSARSRVMREVYHMRSGCECARCSVPLADSWDRYIEAVQCNACRDGLLVRSAGQSDWACSACQRRFAQSAVEECREDAELIAQQAMSLASAQQYEPLVSAVQSKLLHPPATASYPLRLHPYSDLSFQCYFLLMSAMPALPSTSPSSSAAFSSLLDCCRLAVECMEGAGLAGMMEWSDVQVVWGEAEAREGRAEEAYEHLELARERRELQYGKKHVLTRDVQARLTAVSSDAKSKDKSKR